MPTGMVSCRYCRAPLQPGRYDQSSLPSTPPERTDLGSAPLPPPDAQPTKPRKRRRVATEKPAEKRANEATSGESRKTSGKGQEVPTADIQKELRPTIVSQPPDFKWRARVLKGFVVLALLAPLGVSGPVPGDQDSISFTKPMIHSGDEPHYLVLINSVVEDRDLDVKNNYASVHQGGNDAGRKFAAAPLDHHVTWYLHNRCTPWWEIFETDGKLWQRDAAGHPMPTRRKNFEKISLPDDEYSRHSPGLALLLSPFLIAFRNSGWLEPATLLATSLLTIAGFFAFCSFIRPYAANPFQVVMFGAVAYLGSPLWHYGRTLYAEPYAAALLICAYAAVLRSCRYLVGGLFIGAAVLIRTEYFLIALPLLAEPLWRRDRVDSMCAWLPVVAAGFLKLLWNQQMRDGWTHNAELWEWSNPVTGLAGLLFSPSHGILLFAPILLLSAWSFREWFRDHRKDAILVALGVGCYWFLISSQAQWWGGTCYSAKLVVPVLPFMIAPLATLGRNPLWNANILFKAGFAVVMMISVEFGLVAAFSCENVYDKHPIQLLF